MITVEDLVFGYKEDEPLINIPRLEIDSGESVFIYGESGCGKSTLLNLLSGIFLPQRGSIKIKGIDLCHISAHQRDLFRARHLGVIFQQFNLIPYLSVLDNTKLPLNFIRSKDLQDSTLKKKYSWASQLLEELQIPSALHHASVNHLSVGQQQRVAVARALIGGQEILISDEPTSALDEKNQEIFMKLLFQQANQTEEKKTLILVSHDVRLSSWFSRKLSWQDINHV